MFITHHYTLQ
jgi:hypothetical protein